LVNTSLYTDKEKSKLKEPVSEIFAIYFTGKKTWDDLKLRLIKLLKENNEMS